MLVEGYGGVLSESGVMGEVGLVWRGNWGFFMDFARRAHFSMPLSLSSHSSLFSMV